MANPGMGHFSLLLLGMAIETLFFRLMLLERSILSEISHDYDFPLNTQHHQLLVSEDRMLFSGWGEGVGELGFRFVYFLNLGSCGAFPVIENSSLSDCAANMTQPIFAEQSSCSLTCHSGFQMTANSGRLKCERGRWTPQAFELGQWSPLVDCVRKCPETIP